MSDYDDYVNKFEETPGEFDPRFKILDKFMESECYKSICLEADIGDADSVEFMDRYLLILESLQFYIENDHHGKVEYELDNLTNMLKDLLD